MGQAQPARFITVEEYLAGEMNSDVRHEYVNGETYAMVGASDRHGLIALNLATALRPHVRGTPCQLFMADMKVHLQVQGQMIFYYPDLVLSCDPADRETYFRSSPCMIVEVLSETTRRIDQREKHFAYTAIPSLREYVLIDQDRIIVDCRRRRSHWVSEAITDGAVFFECLEVEVPLAVIYEDVHLSGTAT